MLHVEPFLPPKLQSPSTARFGYIDIPQNGPISLSHRSTTHSFSDTSRSHSCFNVHSLSPSKPASSMAYIKKPLPISSGLHGIHMTHQTYLILGFILLLVAILVYQRHKDTPLQQTTSSSNIIQSQAPTDLLPKDNKIIASQVARDQSTPSDSLHQNPVALLSVRTGKTDHYQWSSIQPRTEPREEAATDSPPLCSSPQPSIDYPSRDKTNISECLTIGPEGFPAPFGHDYYHSIQTSTYKGRPYSPEGRSVFGENRRTNAGPQLQSDTVHIFRGVGSRSHHKSRRRVLEYR
ncbi:hypothetical protein FQN57_003889 [Myotisia sp. PD_48]|nr:hypothetical protein FQN57_003889 [Myotisia sp. PD_48]